MPPATFRPLTTRGDVDRWQDVPPPRDDVELFVLYAPLVQEIGRRTGVARDALDDFTSEIMLAYLEAGYVRHYWENDGPRRGPFSSWLIAYVAKKAYSFSRTGKVRVVSSDERLFAGLTSDATLADVHPAFSEMDRQLEWIVSRSELASFLDWLHDDDLRLYRLACLVCTQVLLESEEINRNKLASDLGVTRSVVDRLVVRLRKTAETWGLFGPS